MKSKRVGELPLFGRMPKHAEWKLLELFANDLKGFIDNNELKLIKDICQKKDFLRYLELDEYWGLHSIQPSLQPVGTRDACLYALSSFLQKQAWTTEISDVQSNNALLKFHHYEERMRSYNRDGYRALTWSDDASVHLQVSRIQQFIADVLGDFSFEKVTRYAKHGPGGTYGTSSQMGHRYYKYASVPYEVTSDAIHHARRFIKLDERWCRALEEHPLQGEPFGVIPSNELLFQVVPGNRIEFVPKKTDEARTIALEPSMNVMLQLGVDGHIRKNLLKLGIDMNDQQINQRLAKHGSIDNSLATLDLKGASDNIAIVIIEKLFPHEWANYILDLRSDVGILPDGSTVRYEKLSSMGNGYTFAVETLLFAACVYATNPDVQFGIDSHVYGDDIICHSSDVPNLVKLLNLCGFLVNEDKSFVNDTFTRESCGADFYRGINIRPVFLKVPLDELDVFAFYSLHNRLAEWFSRTLYFHEPSYIYTEASCLLQLQSWCSEKWRLYGPPSLQEESAYLAVPEPPYGRTSQGLYRHDRAVARVEKFDPRPDSAYFHLLCHNLQIGNGESEKPVGGSRYTITRRNAYSIRAKRRHGRCFAWPMHHHEL